MHPSLFRLLVLCPLLLAVPTLAGLAKPAPAAAAEAGKRLVVIPFKVLGGTTADAWIGEALAEQLSLALSQAKGLNLIERGQLDQLLKEQGLGQSFMADEASAPQLGRLLGAQQMVLGSVQLDGEALVVSLRLVDAATGQILPQQSLQIQGERGQLFGLQSQLAAMALQKWAGLSAEAAKAQAAALNPTASTQAYVLYQQALGDLREPTDAKLQAAMKSLNQAIALDPDFTLAYAALSEAHAIRASYHYLLPSARPEDMALALDYAQRALRIGSHPEAVYRALARAQFARGDREAALRSIEQALAQKPGDSLSLQAWLEYQPEKIDADQLLRTLLGFGADPENPAILMKLSKLEMSQLRRLVRQRENSPGEASGALDSQIRSKAAKIRGMLETIEAQQPYNPYLRVQFAELALLLDQRAEARRILEQALASDPGNAMLHFAAATTFFSTQQPQDSDFVIAHFRRGLELDPDFAPAHSLWGIYAYFILHDKAQAREHMLAAQQLIPDSAVSPMILAMIAKEDGDQIQAYAYFRRAIENHGKLLGEDISRGTLLMALIELSAAVRQDETAGWIRQLRQGGKGILSYNLRELVAWLTQREDYAQALEVLAQITPAGQPMTEGDKLLYQRVVLLQRLKQSPQDAAVLNDLGRLALLDKQLSEAEGYLLKAYALKPSEPTIVFNLGLLRLNQKADVEAVRLFEQVLSLQPKHAKARLQLGEAKFRLGQKAEAKAIWEALLLDDPSNSDALSALERLH